MPKGAAEAMRRPMYRGPPPKSTGVFEAQSEFPPTKISTMYNNGGLPCRINLKGGEDDKPSGPKGGRDLLWTTPIKELDLEVMLPIFVDGLREKMEPQMFIANRGLEEII